MSTIDAAAAAPIINRHGVTLLSWPAEEPMRQVLAARGVPRVLLIAADCAPPDITDSLEDWMRDPLDSVDLDARARALALRAATMSRAPEPDVTRSDLAHDAADRSAWVIDDHDIARLMQSDIPHDVDAQRPSLDPDSGVLRCGSQLIVLSSRQVPVAELLIDRFGSVVSKSEVAAAYAGADGSTDRAAFKSMILRLGRRLAQADLDLCVVRGRGYVLQHDTRTMLQHDTRTLAPSTGR